MPTRYLVRDVAEAVAFYRDSLGFEVVEEWGEAFAIVARGGEALWLSGPATSAAQPMPSGARPEPGGWNRLVVIAEDFDGLIAGLRQAGVAFRNEPIIGPGGSQVLIEDPSGNPVEVFRPR